MDFLQCFFETTPIFSVQPLVYQTTHGRVPLSYVYGLLNCSSLLDMYLVELLKVPFYGEDLDQIDPLNLPITEVQNRPNDVAVDILVHLSQIMLSKKFQCRDFGKDANLKKYNQEKPPKMLLGSIPVPVTLFVGNNDWFASKNNARRLYNELKASSQCGFNVIAYDKWNHRDFILAKDITKLLYDPLYKAITSMCKGLWYNILLK
ncbi:hypothetical protein NQ315_015509 [Exocentrus adspersus]|uniref:Uncharacterized protein n=1 Tax=Exocentrus adspersus TaxID=1586481 RepID=A0AAV8VQ12_9CUCU|nr:hypothetical protein NQ315_015509 [Exocentrus adspersus]